MINIPMLYITEQGQGLSNLPKITLPLNDRTGDEPWYSDSRTEHLITILFTSPWEILTSSIIAVGFHMYNYIALLPLETVILRGILRNLKCNDMLV